METKVNYALVGAFVLALGAALIAGALWLASGGNLQKKYDIYLAIEDESVAGLSPNAPVKYNGVDVGKVQQISLATGNPEQVNLLFAIERGTPIKEDTVAVLKTQGLTGIAYVELRGGGLNSPPLGILAGAEYPVIRTKPSLSARLENVMTTALAKFDSTSNNINAMLSSENQAAFRSTLADLAAVAHTLAGRKEELDAGIVSAARTFNRAAEASARLTPLIEHLEQSAQSVKTMGDEVARTSASTGKMVDSVSLGMNRFSADTQPELERLLAELSTLATSLRRFSEQTERNPTGLLFGHQSLPPGPGENSSRVSQP